VGIFIFIFICSLCFEKQCWAHRCCSKLDILPLGFGIKVHVVVTARTNSLYLKPTIAWPPHPIRTHRREHNRYLILSSGH
jgi:hypothetical protein